MMIHPELIDVLAKVLQPEAEKAEAAVEKFARYMVKDLYIRQGRSSEEAELIVDLTDAGLNEAEAFSVIDIKDSEVLDNLHERLKKQPDLFERVQQFLKQREQTR